MTTRKTNKRTKKVASRSHRLGNFTRRATIGKAQWLGEISAKIGKAAKNTASEFADGFNAK